ncbi:hypothetical protein [Streptomyces sp. NPDC001594]|uniref:hypothetical protein n=1 Tax=Streptomyces sp. NPDC001594 TaxID=3364590 RepID=UPI0036BE83A0
MKRRPSPRCAHAQRLRLDLKRAFGRLRQRASAWPGLSGTQAPIAYWDGHPVDAVRLADSGSAFTPESGTAQIRLESIKVRAFGQLDRASDALAALSAADRLREQLGEGDELLGG